MNYAAETQAAGRQVMPDLARAFALFGIALVNVGVLAYPPAGGYAAGGLETLPDKAAFFLVVSLFALKSYSLFSFMFGVGFAHQMSSAERAGAGFGGRYARRIIGLLLFGALNIVCLFFGDILVMYALLGMLLFLFRNASPKTLIGWAIALYVVQILMVTLIWGAFAMGSAFGGEAFEAAMATVAAEDARALEAFGSGSFAEAAAYRVSMWTNSIGSFLMVQGIGAFAFFLFGLAAVRNGLIERPDAPFWRRCRRIFLPIGLVIAFASGWIMVNAGSFTSPEAFLGLALTTLASPFVTAGYLGLIAKWAAGSGGAVRTFLARAGTSSLTAYLLQGLLFSLIFSAYGLGLYASLGAAACIAIAAGVAIVSLIFSSLWRTRFRRGPMEIILRNWTYLGSSTRQAA
jgi:uncharacterized protein